MITSRDISLLAPPVQIRVQDFLQLCKQEGIDILITSTYRDYEAQQALYNQGRTTPGNIVTNAKPGYSFHNFRCAFDFVPLINGKPMWNDVELFTKCGNLAEKAGLEWAGRWKTFKELAHCQYTNGLTLEDLRNGKEVRTVEPVPPKMGK